jgi:hypothetical protein
LIIAQPRDRHRVASVRLSLVLAMEDQATYRPFSVNPGYSAGPRQLGEVDVVTISQRRGDSFKNGP